MSYVAINQNTNLPCSWARSVRYRPKSGCDCRIVTPLIFGVLIFRIRAEAGESAQALRPSFRFAPCQVRGLMLDRAFLRPILDDESLTRGLGDEEARVLVDWLVDRAENLAASSLSASLRYERLGALCRRAKSIGRFVRLWCHEEDF